ncbi:hypothetical protein EMIHUDRAFT_228520 [Emiliania huxleyi CCMP1516]|uniref:EF-hand domain-containing protein n=2 Tax=Emiliania huxleyi TaxID=2903 RepID=A0A0D3KFK8_EMIH1|nr:hypothetical protein EMIHUDRAFT_228520 [Emiliania huxleyi CCMP1516]EOD34543.1 hypothetical protein EMIHUDRAFT_228520 [Emiliania huxleyi CCMP1516]|eukprot:XP_005786972.1 hypothetical protein EMIHUDRAFT_228520 [Emiliania huxleyi CCMP1516]
MITVNDIYILDNYPRLATALASARSGAESIGAVVTTHLNGDFLSPCTFTALDGGKVMSEALIRAKIDYVCLGNHEFDIGAAALAGKIGGIHSTTCLNSNIDGPELVDLPTFATVSVGARTAVFGGYATNDLSCYRPSSRPNVSPIDASAFRQTWQQALASLGERAASAALFVPMTHQLVPHDRASAESLAEEDPQLAALTPIILGGHEHDIFVETVGRSTVVKVGQDAERIGVVDIWWDLGGEMHTRVELLPAAAFEPDGEVLAWVSTQAASLDRMMSVPLFAVPEPAVTRYSSKLVRFEESRLATHLLSLIKRGLRRDGVELVVLQAGAVRGKADYQAAPFTLGDLFSELAFECELALVPLPGRVLAESVRDTHELTEINGAPLEPDRLYMVAIYQYLLTGMNSVEPLMTYVRAGGDERNALVVCMKDAWKELLGEQALERPSSTATDEGEPTTGEDAREAERPRLPSRLSHVFADVACDQSKVIREDDLRNFVARRGLERRGTLLLAHMIQSLDQDGDGCVSRKDFDALVQL